MNVKRVTDFAGCDTLHEWREVSINGNKIAIYLGDSSIGSWSFSRNSPGVVGVAAPCPVSTFDNTIPLVGNDYFIDFGEYVDKIWLTNVSASAGTGFLTVVVMSKHETIRVL